MKKRNTGKKIAKYVVIAIILFVLLFPVYWMINCSLLPSNVIMSVPPRFFPINPTLKNFSDGQSGNRRPKCGNHCQTGRV